MLNAAERVYDRASEWWNALGRHLFGRLSRTKGVYGERAPGEWEALPAVLVVVTLLAPCVWLPVTGLMPWLLGLGIQLDLAVAVTSIISVSSWLILSTIFLARAANRTAGREEVETMTVGFVLPGYTRSAV